MVSIQTQAQVWDHKANLKWNQDFETSYSKWIENEVRETWFLEESNPLQRLSFKSKTATHAIDCADFAYILRLYFSWKNGLEFAVSNSNIQISSQSKKWNHIKDPKKRLRAFAEHIIASVDTSTLNADTGLIPLDANSIRPGMIVLADRYRRHTWVLKSVSTSGQPHLIYRDMDHSFKIFRSYYYPPAESIFTKGYLGHDTGGGLRTFRWPEELALSHSELQRRAPLRFSTDQFKISTPQIFTRATEIKRTRAKDSSEDLIYRLDDLCAKVRERTHVVTDAVQLKQQRSIQGPDYDRLSTPSRDNDIRLRISEIDKLAQLSASKISGPARIMMKSYFEPSSSQSTYCPVAIGETENSAGATTEYSEPLGTIAARFRIPGLVSSNPNDDLSARWGLR